MKLDKLRNIGIVAHVDAGKTTLTERLLFVAGATHYIGNVDSGNTTTDSSAQEKAKGITISSAAVSVDWNDSRINIIDTPGHIDFHVEVHRSLRVLDGAVFVFDSVAGVEPQSEANWRLAEQYKVHRIALVNKMDRIGADFEKVLAMIDERLGTNPVAVQLPIGNEHNFQGVIDLVSMKALVWNDDSSTGFEEREIPDALISKVKEYRAYLEEQVVELDEEALLDWLAHGNLENEVLEKLVRQATLARHCVPVLCASAFKNKAIQPVLNAVEKFLPSPLEVEAISATKIDSKETITLGVSSSEEVSALAFKVVNDSHGSLTYLRVYSGTLKTGDKLLNTSKGKLERIGRIYQMHADKKVARGQASAGEIVAIMGAKVTGTGDTLCSQSLPILLERIEIPRSVIDIVIEAKSKEDATKLSHALDKMLAEDPSLKLQVNDLGQSVLSGLGELHLEIVVDKLKTDFNVEALTGRPQVAYQETLTKSVEVTYRHKKQDGGPGQFAVVRILFESIDSDEIKFENKIVGGTIPREFIQGVEKGIREAAQSGVVAGYPCKGFEATLIDGETHENDSSLLAFQIAGKEAFKKAAVQMEPVLMEPVMKVDVVTPLGYIGDCIGDLSSKRGMVTGQEANGANVVITASVPLAEMFGYIGHLRSLTSGRASFSMGFEKYARVPKDLVNKIIGGK
ncbi:MAG: elongation factor G [Kangiellaceae bacterium]|nr:elongation factor G [Kangiellaceae bacterium]